MADIALALLDAIEGTLTTETAAGGLLDDICSFFVLRTSADVPPEYGSETPVLVVSALGQTGETIYLCNHSSRKVLPIRFSLFTENGGDTTDDEAMRFIDIVENVFTSLTFGLADTWNFVSKDYTQTTLPAFSGDWNGASEFICNYTYTDMRST